MAVADPTVSIIVISYNTLEMTRACLRSVYEQTRQTSFELLVVDNNSTDGSASMIAAEFPEAKLRASGENLGFAKGNNVAAADARGEFLLLLNPDTVVLDGAIDKLVAFAHARPAAGIWGGRTVFKDGSLNPTSCWRRQTPWSVFCAGTGLSSVFRKSGVFNPEAYGRWPRDRVREVDIVSGCFLLIRRELWERLGGFDPAFFMYGEEADLCLRAHRLGACPAITPDATIVHYGGASEKVRADKLVRLLKAKSLLIRRHWGRLPGGAGVAMLAAWPLSRSLALRGLRVVDKSRGAAAETWSEVWRRRREWYGGGTAA